MAAGGPGRAALRPVHLGGLRGRGLARDRKGGGRLGNAALLPGGRGRLGAAGALRSNGHSSSSELTTVSPLLPFQHSSCFLVDKHPHHARHPAKVCQGTHEAEVELLSERGSLSLPSATSPATGSSPRISEQAERIIHKTGIPSQPCVSGGNPRAPAAGAFAELLFPQQVQGAPLHRLQRRREQRRGSRD
ncbi:hypothetical protein AV530_011379 [Patagioenas fasciata monilis]|uniref:Uncharacterized protein n=1 Tax=Patagioenas fasciata monilis TaxID=372326 RepID=A0A1V4KR09_PATFA|nr:hypothetical protein AV530_011379 [Patagioenas fasciata monilis]